MPDKYAKAKAHIKKNFERNKGRYGYRRAHIVLRKQGIALNHKTIQRLMNMMGLQGNEEVSIDLIKELQCPEKEIVFTASWRISSVKYLFLLKISSKNLKNIFAISIMKECL